MSDWPPEPERRFFTVEDMTPYFRSRAKQKRICPECHKAALEVRPTLSPNGGVDHCPECGYFQVVVAPENAKAPEDRTRPREGKCRIISFSEAKAKHDARTGRR